MKRAIVAAATVCLALGGAVAEAHHSAAMFDREKTVTLTGVVKAFQWTNPHTWVQLEVAGEDGKAVEWSLEGGGPSAMYRRGWRPSSLRPGDKVTLTTHPLKSGQPGGSLMQVTLADGRTLS